MATETPAGAELMFDTTLLDESGNKVTLSEFWQQRTTVFIWLRHFG